MQTSLRRHATRALVYTPLTLALALIAQAVPSSATSTPAPIATSSASTDSITDEGNLLASITAKVESIDSSKRQLTLRGPQDNVVTISAGKNVTRFNEIKVGDYITADYYVSLALDLSMPDPDDMDNPITITDMTEKAPADSPPGAAEFNVIRVIATVEGMDAPTQTLALRGPQGRHVLVAVKDVEELKQLRLDDKVTVLCTQAVLVSVEKASQADADKVKRSAENKSMNKRKSPTPTSSSMKNINPDMPATPSTPSPTPPPSSDPSTRPPPIDPNLP